MPKVKVCVKEGPGQVRLDELELGDPLPGEVLIRTELTTICGSDLHLVDDMPLPPGIPQGHEGLGVIEAVGDGVERFKVGDRVVTSCLLGCGTCALCSEGDFAVCKTAGAPVNLLLGCQGEAFKVRFADHNLALVPEGLDNRQVLFAGDIMSTGFGAVERGGIKPGQTVAVFAQGPVGLCATAGAKCYGAGRIIAVESVPERIALAKQLGADEVVDPADAVERIMALTGGHGVDLAIEALGKPITFANCLEVTRPGGTVSSVGVYANVESLPLPGRVPLSNKRIVFTMCPGGSERLEYLIGLVQKGKTDLTPLWTHSMPLADIVRGYDDFRTRKHGTVKIAIS